MPAAHDQIILAYTFNDITALELVDFAPPSLTPQEKTTIRITFVQAFGNRGGVMKIKIGKFGLPANPYDQVVYMFASTGKFDPRESSTLNT